MSGLAIGLVGLIVLIVSLSDTNKKPVPKEPTQNAEPEQRSEQPGQNQVFKTDNPIGKSVITEDMGKLPDVPAGNTLRLLYQSAAKVDVKALRKEVEAQWPTLPPPSRPAVRVSRSPGSVSAFRSLAEACARTPGNQGVVIEIHDNGPIFELPVALNGRDLTIRAGKGYRPLIIWDLPATVADRRRLKKIEPLAFISLGNGKLTLEGIEFAWRWPEEILAEPAAFLDVRGGGLNVSDCTFSAAGKPPAGVTLARVSGSDPKARCRFSRCQARGSGLTALDLAAAADTLIDRCLFVGGGWPLLRVRSVTEKGPSLHVVRSTLVCGRTLLEVLPSAMGRGPGLSFFGWDSLLSRSGAGEGGELFAVRGGADTGPMSWRPVNCLYAGWGHLLSGPTNIVGEDIAGWHRHWKINEGDEVARNTWPMQEFNEPASLPAATYSPTEPVRFASTVEPNQPLGCDLSSLPPARDDWIRLALNPSWYPPEAPSDDSAPEIPNPGDNRFHGARLDLTLRENNLGDYLDRIQKSGQKLGPRVVMHLSGNRPVDSSPIRIRGSTLVLYFEEPTEKNAQRLAIRLGRVSEPVPLIDVENGNLEIIGGELRATDLATANISHLIKVNNGDLKLYRTRLEGPQQWSPAGYRSVISFTGSGDPTPERMRSCALNECIVRSNRAGIQINGVGCSLLLRQSVVVAGTDGLQFMPGRECKGRAGMQCSLENVTFACRSAVVRLGDAPAVGIPSEPVMIHSRIAPI